MFLHLPIYVYIGTFLDVPFDSVSRIFATLTIKMSGLQFLNSILFFIELKSLREKNLDSYTNSYLSSILVTSKVCLEDKHIFSKRILSHSPATRVWESKCFEKLWMPSKKLFNTQTWISLYCARLILRLWVREHPHMTSDFRLNR